MRSALATWAEKFDGEATRLYWLLAGHMAEVEAGPRPAIPASLAGEVRTLQNQASAYWDDIRYSSLEPVTKLWGTVVNALRVVADSNAATDAQKAVFAFDVGELMAFFLAARSHMEVADSLFHSFKAMPAPE